MDDLVKKFETGYNKKDDKALKDDVHRQCRKNRC